jgi:hypothetical protein
MKHLEKLLFNYGVTHMYSYVAGILVSVGIQSLGRAVLQAAPVVSVYRAYAGALSALISSIGAFGLSAVLQEARASWAAAGRPTDPEVARDPIEKPGRLRLAWVFFAMIALGPILFGLVWLFLVPLLFVIASSG